MTTLGNPIPPKPAVFAADGTPGSWCEYKHVNFTRPKLKHIARLIVVHTNAASEEGSIESAWNWAHAAPNSNTVPTYQVDRSGRARKMLRSDEDAIANCTVESMVPRGTEFGDVSEWSLAIETADLGTNHGIGGFTDAQGDAVATIIAYEALLWGIPLVIPNEWFEAGVGAHTDPFPFPFWTCKSGKTCPGDQKKAEFKSWILPRAIEIHRAWTSTEEEFVMTPEVEAAFAAVNERLDNIRTRVDQGFSNSFERDQNEVERDRALDKRLRTILASKLNRGDVDEVMAEIFTRKP